MKTPLRQMHGVRKGRMAIVTFISDLTATKAVYQRQGEKAPALGICALILILEDFPLVRKKPSISARSQTWDSTSKRDPKETDTHTHPSEKKILFTLLM